MDLKNHKRGRIKEYVNKYPKATYEATRPDQTSNPLWNVKCDVALPSATQNEINAEDANNLVKNGCTCISEGANMPSTPEAINVFLESKILYGLGKAANAGGVAVSGLEMSQNSMRLAWTREDVDKKLHEIMKNIHKTCVDTAAAYGTPGNYVNGANIAGFLKVADSMMAQGLV
jgi:glutamate dehydrogenase (NADP+)